MEKRQLKAYSMFYLEKKKRVRCPAVSLQQSSLIFPYSPCKNIFQMCYTTWISLSVLRLTHPYELFPGGSSPKTFKYPKCCITDISQHIQSGKGFIFMFRKYLHVCTYICLHVYQTYNICKSIRVICTAFLNYWFAWWHLSCTWCSCTTPLTLASFLRDFQHSS